MFLRMLIKSGAFFPLAFLILFAVFQVQAAVTVDSRSAGGAFSNTGVTTLSWMHTVGSGSNRAIFVGISTTSAAGIGTVCMGIPGGCTSLPETNLPIMSLTYDGVAMIPVISVAGTDRQVSIYRLVNPPTGTGTVTATFVAGTVTHAVGNSVSFFGVNQTTPTANAIGTGGTNNTPTVFVSGSGVTTDDMVFDALASTPNAGFFLEGAGQTVCTDPMDETTCTRGRRFFFTSYDVGASSTEQADPAGTTMSWTMTTAQPWVLAATVVKAALPVTAAAVSVSGQVMGSKGRGISRANVVLTNVITGEIKYAATNSFGYYRFTDVSVGATYSIEVRHKRYQFPLQVITVLNEVENLNFTTEP